MYDCKGGPGTTDPACGACITCLHRVIEEKDAHIKRLEEAGDKLSWYSTSKARHEWAKAKEGKP